MKASYTNDPSLFPRCIELIDSIFPGCKEFAMKGEKYRASWREASIPFIIEEQGEIIAHAGIWPMTFWCNAKEHQTAFIHGVCVKPAHRGKGYFKELMREAMDYANAHYDSFSLFTVKPYLYKNYALNLMLPEYDFVLHDKLTPSASKSSLRVLDLDHEQDLNILFDLHLNRVPLSDQFSPLHQNAASLFVLNSLHRKIYYSKHLNAIIMHEIRNNHLYINEIISNKQHNLRDIIEVIPGSYHKIILQFCPDRFVKENDYNAVLAGPECCILFSDRFEFKGKCFRYPELYWC